MNKSHQEVTKSNCMQAHKSSKLLQKIWLIFAFNFIILSSLIFTHKVDAETYYVDATNGLDSNPGTEIQPWKTINKVNISMDAPAIIQAGDYIFFKKGETFTGYLDVDVTGTVGNIIGNTD